MAGSGLDRQQPLGTTARELAEALMRMHADGEEPRAGREQDARSELTPIVEVKLFGSFELFDGPGQPVRLSTRKAEGLLTLLATRPGQPQARDKLCALLWPEVREAQARHSLRQTLLQLRKALSSAEAPLFSDARGLQLSASAVSVDVIHMERCIALGTRDALLEAWHCYRGDLLEGFSVGEAPFDDWLRSERERLRGQFAQALTQLVAIDGAAERHADAIRACSRLLELDPLREEAHRSLMRLLAAGGQRTAALQHYRAFAAKLRSQLCTEPDPLTQQLYAELEGAASLRDSVSPPAPVQAGAATTAGRSRELAQLMAALADAVSAKPGVTLLAGEAGVGKTHLCERVTQEAQSLGFRVLRARCFESEQVLPLSPWANLLRAAITPDMTLAREQRAQLATLVPELSSDEPARSSDARQLFHAVQQLVQRVSESAPLLLLLEDIHWADEMSARLLSYLGRHQRQTRCLILVSAREEDVGAGSVVHAALAELSREQLLSRVELTPLSNADSLELSAQLAERLGLGPLEAARQEQIWAISEGNPLVIVESLRALAFGALARDVSQLPVPERVRSLILSRVARVSTVAREVLSLAAVAGRELEPEVLSTALTDVPLTAALDELARSQLVRAVDERVYFTHDRIRETLYAEMLPVTRRLLHGQVARALEQQGPSYLPAALGHIGYHYSKAGDAQLAVRYLMRFAEAALREHGVSEALTALDRAFVDSARLPESERERAAVEIVLRQAYCLISLGRVDALVTRMLALSARVEALGAPDLAGQFHFFWGFAYALTAQRRAAEAQAERALAYAERCNDTRMIGYAHALLSYLCQMTGRARNGVTHGELATQLLEAYPDSHEAATIAWVSLGLNRLWLGGLRAALQAFDKAASIARAAEHPRGQAVAATAAGCAYAYTEQWELALEATQRGIAASKDPFTLVGASWMAGWAQAGSGQTAQAIALLTHVIEQLAAHGMRAWSGHAGAILADAQLRAGDAEKAAQTAREALDVATTTDDHACAGWALRFLGQALTVLGQLPAARAALDRSVAGFELLEARVDLAKTLIERAALSRVEARWEEAQADLKRARELFHACDVQAPLARVAQLQAALDRR